MNFRSSRKVSQRSIKSVAESAHLPANLSPGFFSAFQALHDNENGTDQENNKNESNKPSGHQQTGTESGANTPPEIFCLLKKYQFSEFLRLFISGDRPTLMMVIKKNRKSRGINHATPVSHQYRKNEEFITEIGNRYLQGNRLMEPTRGQSYNGQL